MALTIWQNFPAISSAFAGIIWFVSGIAMTDIPYMETSTVAERIRSRLDALNKNPSAVALEAGLSRSSVLDILKGKAANPRLDTLKKLTGPLQCSLAYLTGDRDDPSPDRLTEEEYALLDTDIQTEAIVLATGVYRERDSELSQKIAPTLVYRDPNHPKERAGLAVMGDDSLAGIGILAGDQLTYLGDGLGDIELPLAHGSIAIVRRDLGTEASEYSARQVEILEGKVSLVTRPASGDPKFLSISSHEVMDDDHIDWLRNHYLIEPHKSVVIEGLVIRVTRVLPDPF